jgi:hypothetical protein
MQLLDHNLMLVARVLEKPCVWDIRMLDTQPSPTTESGASQQQDDGPAVSDSKNKPVIQVQMPRWLTGVH